MYIGQEAQTTARAESGPGKPMGFRIGKIIGMDIQCQSVGVELEKGCFPTDFGIDNIKPILRPLSDMTEDECKAICRVTRDAKATLIILTAVGKEAHNPQITVWLLKQGFDLFQLTPSGQAIDKTKLTTGK